MNILFTICGRAGSKGFKNKNLKEMNGVPLVFYSLAAIQMFSEKHMEHHVKIAVNTDSCDLIEQIKGRSALPIEFVSRRQELAGDVVPKVDVIKDTYINCVDFNADVVMDLDITSPMRRVEDIENILEEYNKGGVDLVFSVVEARRSPYFNMVENKGNGYYQKICQSSFTARQQAPKSYEINASIYAYNPLFLSGEIEKTILDYKCSISIMPDFLVLDIDSEEDFEMMQFLHRYYCEHDSGLNNVFCIARQMSAKNEEG